MGSYPCTDCIPDTVNGFHTVRALYEASADTKGKYSVPVLWDKQQKTIVNNESSDILRMFNSEFQALATAPQVDLYPEELREAIDHVNSWVYPNINDGVYRCGFATKQAAYDEAFK
jgi:putative glutathione S-transferase